MAKELYKMTDYEYVRNNGNYITILKDCYLSLSFYSVNRGGEANVDIVGPRKTIHTYNNGSGTIKCKKGDTIKLELHSDTAKVYHNAIEIKYISIISNLKYFKLSNDYFKDGSVLSKDKLSYDLFNDTDLELNDLFKEDKKINIILGVSNSDKFNILLKK